MESSSRRERSKERRRKQKRDYSRDRRHRHQSSDSEEKNGERKRKDHKRARSRSRRRHERSVSRHRSQTPKKISGNKLIAETTQNFLNDSVTSQDEERKARRKSRWAGTVNDKVFVPGIPSIIPSNLNKEQQEAYLLQLNIGEITCKLRSGNWEIPENPKERSPSPEPIYNSNGTRLNTREFRIRSKLEEQRHNMVLHLKTLNPSYIPPPDYKPPTIRFNDKIMIPQEEYPETNFIGLLIGPRGNTLKRMQQETGAKIIIRGKGSVKEGKTGNNKNGEPLPGENEPLHAYISATTPESMKNAIDKINKIIKQGIEVPESENDLRKMQLRELAVLNGTLRDGCDTRCSNCGAIDHRSWLCPDKPNITSSILCNTCGSAGHIAKDCKQEPTSQVDSENSVEKVKIESEYLALMAELGEAPIEGAAFMTQNKPSVKIETNKKTAHKLNPIFPSQVSDAANSSTELVTYSMPNASTTWNQTSFNPAQMAMPWHMPNMQESWIGNQFPWTDGCNYLTPAPPLQPINVNNFFASLPLPPPPPPRKEN